MAKKTQLTLRRVLTLIVLTVFTIFAITCAPMLFSSMTWGHGLSLMIIPLIGFYAWLIFSWIKYFKN